MFNPGDKVRCVKESALSEYAGKKGEILTVESADEEDTGSLTFKEYPGSFGNSSSRFELMETKTTSDVKAGDKIRILVDEAESADVEKGDICIVLDVSLTAVTYRRDDGTTWGASPYKEGITFERVEEESEIERLVRVANEGYKAVDILMTKYRAEIEIKSAASLGWQQLDPGNPPDLSRANREMRIKPKPAFEPFTVGKSWRVDLDGDKLYVGCRHFAAKNALDVLCLHCRNNKSVSVVQWPDGGYSPSISTRDGIDVDGHMLTWEDADRILAALEKADI